MSDEINYKELFNRAKDCSQDFLKLQADNEYRAKNLVPFGISFLDGALDGILPNDLILIGAQTGAGKTTLATSLAKEAALLGKRVLYFALEADKREIASRLAFSLLASQHFSDQFRSREDVSFKNFYLGKLNHWFSKYDIQKDSWLANIRCIYSQTGYGLDDFRRDLTQMRNEIDVVIIDHLHYLDLPDESTESYKQAVKEIRNLALEYSKPVVLVAQLRKKSLAQPSICPENDDFHGSSDITKIATKVITIAPGGSYVPSASTTKISTFMRAGKYRLDGSVVHFIASLNYDIPTGSYSKTFTLGRQVVIKNKVQFEPIENEMLPNWAKGAK